jgi:hypothetical protein
MCAPQGAQAGWLGRVELSETLKRRLYGSDVRVRATFMAPAGGSHRQLVASASFENRGSSESGTREGKPVCGLAGSPDEDNDAWLMFRRELVYGF